MKFLRFLCNFLMFFAVAFGISFVQVGLFDLSAAQSRDIQPIMISATEDEDIGYLDSYVFWVDDIAGNFEAGSKHRIRGWINADWWKTGMAWADTGLDAVIAATKPILVPIAQVNAIKNYYGYTVAEFEDYVVSDYKTVEAANNALYEAYIIFDKGYGELPYTFGENSVLISEYEYTGNGLPEDANFEAEYSRWTTKNKKLYNTMWKLSKYNSPRYEKWFKKFISYREVELENGVIKYEDRHIKTAITVMYYQQYVSLIVALIFVIKYPVSLLQVNVEAGDKDKRRRKK